MRVIPFVLLLWFVSQKCIQICVVRSAANARECPSVALSSGAPKWTPSPFSHLLGIFSRSGQTDGPARQLEHLLETRRTRSDTMSELHSHVCFEALQTLQNVQSIEEQCKYIICILAGSLYVYNGAGMYSHIYLLCSPNWGRPREMSKNTQITHTLTQRSTPIQRTHTCVCITHRHTHTPRSSTIMRMHEPVLSIENILC